MILLILVLPFLGFVNSPNTSHFMGIPYNPQGQGIVERAHLTFKLPLIK